MTGTIGADKNEGGYYIFQHIAQPVWDRRPAIRLAHFTGPSYPTFPNLTMQ